ncbi:MAG: DUF6265 family protein [Terracidiphilus sp.]
MKRILIVVGLIAFITFPATAQTKANISDLGWMAGDWTASVGGNTAQRNCSELTGGSMTCALRVIAAGKAVWLEFSALRETANGIVLDTRFFTPDLQPADPVSNGLVLKSAAADEWVFDNPNGTQPKNAIVTRLGDDAMRSHADLVDQQGKASVIDVSWQRVR